MSAFTPKSLAVPGLLTDDELTRRLKLFASEGRAKANSAPPSNSAFDFADRIMGEYLDRTLRTEGLRSGASTVGRNAAGVIPSPYVFADQPGPGAAQQGRVGYRADRVAEAIDESPLLRLALLGPLGAAVSEGGPLAALGAITDPVEREAEAKRRAKGAEDFLTTAQDRIAMREKLRQLDIGGSETADASAAEAATDAPDDRRMLAVAGEKAKRARAAVEDPSLAPDKVWWLDAAQRFVRSTADTMLNAVEALPVAWDVARDLVLGDDGQTGYAREALDTVSASLEKMLPGDPARAKDFISELAQGSGSMVAFALASQAAMLRGGAAALGAAASATQQVEDAERFGASEAQKLFALLAGGALGVTEAIPIDNMLFRLDRATGGGVRRLLRTTAAASAEEFLQEAGQTFGEDLVARLTYDAERDMDPARYLRAGAIGAVSGGLLAVGTSALRSNGVVRDNGPVYEDAQIAAMADTVLAETQQKVNELTTRIDAEARAEELMGAATSPFGELVTGKGGNVPVNQNGAVELHHWSGRALDVVDPDAQGTGPLRGEERGRLAAANAPKRSYYGVGNPRFPQDFAAEQKALPAKARRYKSDTDPYHGEGLGLYRHTVALQPDEVYNWYEDPLKLRDRLERTAPSLEQVTAYEALIRDAGFKGVYFDHSPIGQTALVFEKMKPTRVVNELFNLPVDQIAQPADFEAPTPETFKKGGWAILTATQEAKGDHTTPENVAANEKLRAELARKGVQFKEVEGAYKGVGQGVNFLVFMPEKEALKLGRKYGQESILTREGLEYADGRLTPVGAGGTTVGDSAREQDFYSTLPNGVSFTVDLNFDATVNPKEIANSALDLMAMVGWHGTPHQFRQFALEHIGKGEGNQSYGWGLYFAGRKETAEWYREKLTERNSGSFSHLELNGEQVDDLNDPAIFEAVQAASAWREITYVDNGTLLGKQTLKLYGIVPGSKGYAELLESFKAGFVSVDPPSVVSAALNEAVEAALTLRQKGVSTALQEISTAVYGAYRREGTYLSIAQETGSSDRLERSAKTFGAAARRFLILGNVRGAMRPSGPLKVVEKKPKGALFKVDIPGDEELLSWDEPLEKQPKELLDKLRGRTERLPFTLEKVEGETWADDAVNVWRTPDESLYVSEYANDQTVTPGSRFQYEPPSGGLEFFTSFEAAEARAREGYEASAPKTISEIVFPTYNDKELNYAEATWKTDAASDGGKRATLYVPSKDTDEAGSYRRAVGLGTVEETTPDNFTLMLANPRTGVMRVLDTRAGTLEEGKRIVSGLYDELVAGRATSLLEDADYLGSDLYSDLKYELGGAKQASLALRRAGIPGLRYLDGFSRRKGEGSSNYVIFDDARIAVDAINGKDPNLPDDDLFAMRKQLTPRELADAVPGVAGILPHLTDAERDLLSARTAQRLVDVFQNLPSPEEMTAVAVAGRVKKGWYADSAKALVDIFGMADAPRFAALLAALSPRVPVETNVANAIHVWTAWLRAGRPVDANQIRRLVATATFGGDAGKAALPAWMGNSVEALTSADPDNVQLSGPKVNAFASNLRGEVNAVTVDAWMANYANTEAVIQGRYVKQGERKVKVPGAGYLAMSAAIRRAAETATRLTGETWTPAEIQETVWSWAKALYERASLRPGETAADLLRAGRLTEEDIAGTPDFAHLLMQGVYKKLLAEGGYDVERLAEGGAGANGGSKRRSGAEGVKARQASGGAFERHLQNAAARLDALRIRRFRDEVTRAGGDPDAELTRYLDAARPDLLGPAADVGEGFTDEDIEGLFAQTSQGRAPFKEEPSRPAGGVAGESDSKIDLTAVVGNLTKLLDLTLRQGRKTLKGDVVGQYSAKQDVARVDSPSDFSTVVHEAGHKLHLSGPKAVRDLVDANAVAFGRIAVELYGADIMGETLERKSAEGFAEFFRVYMTNRAFAERHYGTLVTDFDAALDTINPALKDGLSLVREQFGAWLQLPSSALFRNMIVSTQREGAFEAAVNEVREAGFGSWFHEHARNAVKQAINKYAAVDDLVADVLNIGQENRGKAIDLKRADDPRVLLRLGANSGARATVQITDGVMGYRSLTPSTRGLRDALLISQGFDPKKSAGKIDRARQQDFAAYLVALRAIDEYRRMDLGLLKRPPVAATLGDARQTVADMDAKYGASFADAAKIIHDYGMALWQKSYDAGLISRETYLDGQTRQFYAPLQRDMSDKKEGLGGSVLTDGKASIVKRMRGSDRRVLDPVEVLMHKTYALERTIAENEVKRTLAALADAAGKAGALVERVPARQMAGQQYSVADVARQLAKDDTLTETDAADLMTLLGGSINNENLLRLFHSEPASAAGENILWFWEQGKLSAIQLKDGEVGRDVMQLMQAVGQEHMPLLTELIAIPSTLVRSAITAWPDFVFVNFIRDQFSAFILTDVGFTPFLTGLKGVANELRQTTVARDYNAAMGAMGGMNVAAMHDARVQHDLDALRKKGYIAKAFEGRGLAGAARGWAHLTEVPETGTRLGLFEKAFARAKADGLSEWEASVEAGYIATDYMNFGLHGSRMLMLKRLIPFLGAQINGLYKLARTLGGDEVRQRKGLAFVLSAYFKDLNGLDLSRTERDALQTGRKAWVKMASLGILSALLWAAFRDDPDYQDASEYLRATGWVIPTGDGHVYYIPKPFELAILANITERALEAASGDEAAAGRFLRGAAMNLTPPIAPPAIQVALEEAINKDFFVGTSIVPDYMQGLEPELQYTASTSEIAKRIGEITGMSPLRVDHVLGSLGASAYRDIAAVTNAMTAHRPGIGASDTPVLRRFVRDARRGAASTRDFWDMASTTDGALRRAEVSYRNMLEAGKDREADLYLRGRSEDEQAYALLNAHYAVKAKRLHPIYRARQIATVVGKLRREMSSELGVEDTTTTKGADALQIPASAKRQIDQALSEYTRRELRNALVTVGAPGWMGDRRMPTAPTVDMIEAVWPELAAELDRRMVKAKVYDGAFVEEAWPELKSRLLSDRDEAFLQDLTAAGEVTRWR